MGSREAVCHSVGSRIRCLANTKVLPALVAGGVISANTRRGIAPTRDQYALTCSHKDEALVPTKRNSVRIRYHASKEMHSALLDTGPFVRITLILTFNRELVFDILHTSYTAGDRLRFLLFIVALNRPG